MHRYKCQCQYIYNVDGTAVRAAQNPAEISARKGVKQAAAVTSQQRGSLATMAVSVNEIGNSIPSFFVLPREDFQTKK
jgi:hypothetical protein